jgi:hypothetical protein
LRNRSYGHAPHATRASFFCRRRWTELPMPIASRYFATVRRARSKPFSRSSSTSLSSDRMSSGFSASHSARICALTVSAETELSPSAEATPLVKKYFSSNVPRWRSPG